MSKLTRRSFLNGVLLPAALGTLPRRAVQGEESDDDADSQPDIIDTNVHLFDWPFRKLKYAGAKALVAKLRLHRIKQAWAGSYEGLLHEDFVLAREVQPDRAGLGAEPKNDLLAFVRRSAVDGYATAERMAVVVRAGAGAGRYPASELGQHLGLMARLIKGGIGTRVYYARQPGYDTHATQFGPHAVLLRELSGAVKAFLDDLAAAKVADRVTVLVFSEFGRTVKENGSAGTDHGTAGPVFLAGPCVKAGVVGTMPKLLDPDPKHGDLRVRTDFRRVYATVLEDWLGLPATAALPQGGLTPHPGGLPPVW
jgi:hypothetical protein